MAGTGYDHYGQALQNVFLHVFLQGITGQQQNTHRCKAHTKGIGMSVGKECKSLGFGLAPVMDIGDGRGHFHSWNFLGCLTMQVWDVFTYNPPPPPPSPSPPSPPAGTVVSSVFAGKVLMFNSTRTGDAQCLDTYGGGFYTQIVTWQCLSDANTVTNQAFYVADAGGGVVYLKNIRYGRCVRCLIQPALLIDMQ
jgi:hypothetical protein